MSMPVMVEGMLVTLAMLELRLPTTPVPVATSVVPLVVIAGVVEAARLLQPAEAGRFDAFLDAACCRLSLCDDGHDERIHLRMLPSKASLSVSCHNLWRGFAFTSLFIHKKRLRVDACMTGGGEHHEK
jgi:hypothetical protein